MSSYIQDKISVSGFLDATLHPTFSICSHGTRIPKAKILFAAVHWFENPSKLHNCNHQGVSCWRFSLRLHLRIILQCQQFTWLTLLAAYVTRFDLPSSKKLQRSLCCNQQIHFTNFQTLVGTSQNIGALNSQFEMGNHFHYAKG